MPSKPSEMFKVLGVETRLKIIELLKSKGPLGVKKISQELGITPAAVSQHLKILKHVGLVQNERQGFYIPYSIDEAAMEHCRTAISKVCECGCKGHAGIKMMKVDHSSIEALMAHKNQLELELKRVDKKISQMKKGKK